MSAHGIGTTAQTMSGSVGRSLDGGEAKPPPRDLSHHYSQTTRHRMPSKMKEYYKFFFIPGIGNIAGGLPNPRFFPFDTLEAQTAKPDRWTPTPNKPAAAQEEGGEGPEMVEAAGADRMAPAHITVPKLVEGAADPRTKIDLATALQYGTGDGYPPLLSWVRQFARENLHPDVPYAGGPEVVLTVGSTDGMAKTLELLVDPWSAERGDDPRDRPGLLCERFVYGNVLNQAAPKGVRVVAVAADAGGMCARGPGGLEDVLANWDPATGRRPHLMYTVTMGHNPTGVLLGRERRREIYGVCSRYDVVIIEDDPYWYLQFPSAAAEEAKSRHQPIPRGSGDGDDADDDQNEPRRSTGYPFLDSLVPSFLSFDTDGRVIRLDTFSKTVAPGCRLGWITAQPALIERLVRITESMTQQPSGFVQSMIGELVMGPQPAPTVSAYRSLRGPRERATFSGWKTDGWVRWLAGLRGEYERRMARMCRILDAGAVQLKQGTPLRAADADWGVVTKTTLFEYRWPRGGMFVWLRMLFESHPLWGAPRGDAGELVVDGMLLSPALMMFLTRKPYLVLVSTGLMFSADANVAAEDGWAFYRLCFAAEAEELIDPCAHRFVDGVHRFWKIKTVRELEELVKGAPMALTGAASFGGAEYDDGEEGSLDTVGMYPGC